MTDKETLQACTTSATIEKTEALHQVKVEFTSMSEHFNVVLTSATEKTEALVPYANKLMCDMVDKMNKRKIRGYE